MRTTSSASDLTAALSCGCREFAGGRHCLDLPMHDRSFAAYAQAARLGPSVKAWPKIDRSAGTLHIHGRDDHSGDLCRLSVGAKVWLLPSSENGQFSVIVMMTYLIAAREFMHIVAGSIEGSMLVWNGIASVQTITLKFMLASPRWKGHWRDRAFRLVGVCTGHERNREVTRS